MSEGLYFFYGLVVAFYFICLWIVYQKADKPGWGAIIPVYNVVLLCDIAGISRWWTLSILFPLVFIVVWVFISFEVSRNFGQSPLFGFGLLFLPIIFYAILAFGDSSYRS